MQANITFVHYGITNYLSFDRLAIFVPLFDYGSCNSQHNPIFYRHKTQ